MNFNTITLGNLWEKWREGDIMKDTKNEVKFALQLGERCLVYTKLNEETRTAMGTTNLDLIPKEFHPKTKEVPAEPKPETDLIHYYDINSKGWRCFWLENLISLSIVPNELSCV